MILRAYVVKTSSDLALAPAGAHEKLDVVAATLGYVYDFSPVASVLPGVGAAFTVDVLDRALETNLRPPRRRWLPGVRAPHAAANARPARDRQLNSV
ncbi:MAG TPA: hypothetical protein VMR31_05765 [Myxococcota bacterium]|nr:hypothetical protein [Myxococcota bacterium]